VVTITSLALLGLVWVNATQAARQAAEAERRTAEAMAAAQATSEEMLKRLQRIGKADEPGRSGDWIPVTFKLVQEKLDGPPAVDYKVSIGRGTGGSIGSRSISRDSDENGVADFGVVQPGDWEFRIVRAAEDGRNWNAQGNLNILPGVGVAKTIICPVDYSENVPIRVRVEWPADLADQKLYLAARFEYTGLTYQAPVRWHFGAWGGMGEVHNATRELLCRPAAKVAGIVSDDRFFLWRLNADGQGRVFADLSSELVLPGSEQVKLAAGSYRLSRLIALAAVLVRPPDLSVERFDFIAQVLRRQLNAPATAQGQMLIHSLTDAPSKSGSLAPSSVQNVVHDNYLTFPSSFLSQTKGKFEARPDQSNEWVIPLPDELIKVVRERLKAGETATKP
jgi:hypothetical protein